MSKKLYYAGACVEIKKNGGTASEINAYLEEVCKRENPSNKAAFKAAIILAMTIQYGKEKNGSLCHGPMSPKTNKKVNILKSPNVGRYCSSSIRNSPTLPGQKPFRI